MKTKLTTTLVAVLGALALAANAQDNNQSPGGPPPGEGQPPMQHAGGPGGPGGRGGFHLLPPRAAESLKLTDDQKAQLVALEAETKAKLEKILTADQLAQLKNMRPPMRQGGPGGGPMRGGDGNMPPSGPPPGDGNGPSGPPSGNQ